MTNILEGDPILDIAPLKTGSATLTISELEELLNLAAYKGYLLAEEKRQAYLTTPDGLLDKTISNYKPNPYSLILSQSSPLLLIEGTGTEEWKGDIPSDLSPELIDEINTQLFSVFPRPLQLSERTSP